MCARSVLLVGSGGREHALARQLARCQVQHILVCPGNAGTAAMPQCTNYDISSSDFHCLAGLVKEKQVELVVVGPEEPLDKGLVDYLTEHCPDTAVFGPTKAAARIESDKAYCKRLMFEQGIPSAEYIVLNNMNSAQHQIIGADSSDMVIKANGLCAGKGVFVCSDKTSALQAARMCLQEKKFGAAGETIIVEEKLVGQEISVMAFSDGVTVAVMPAVQDHKRVADGDKGPNTGGMGAYCPCPLVTDADMQYIEQHVINKLVRALHDNATPFKGVLFAGIMLTDTGPKVLEFNCRFGDPETQVVLPLLTTPLVDVLLACCQGRLGQLDLQWNHRQAVCDVVVAAAGYPGSYAKGHQIAVHFTESDSLYAVHAGTRLEPSTGTLLTDGGRVLHVLCLADSLDAARSRCTSNAALVKFDGAFFRHDIAQQAVRHIKQKTSAYAAAGVCIDEGNKLVHMLKPVCDATRRPGCPTKGSLIGGFAAEFDLAAAGYRKPILMLGTDGVGTKLELATATGLYSGIGHDLVGMCANDVLCHGAEPLAFLDYYVTGRLQSAPAYKVIDGVANACRLAGCALVGGETAEMPGVYDEHQWDIAGTVVGALEAGVHPKLPLVNRMKSGDLVIGFPSSGLHSNGFSLVRKILDEVYNKNTDFDVPCPWQSGKTLGEALLVPTEIYVKRLLPLVRQGHVLALAHVTGGGIAENLARVLPDHLGAQIDCCKWPKLPVFGWLHSVSSVSLHDLLRTFNCGLGMLAVVAPDALDAFAGVQHYVVGQLCQRRSLSGRLAALRERRWQQQIAFAAAAVELVNQTEAFDQTSPPQQPLSPIPAITVNDQPIISEARPVVKRVAVLISGTGSNMECLVAAAQQSAVCDVVLVVSNRRQAAGIARAQAMGVHTLVLEPAAYDTREVYDQQLHATLVEHNIDVVCLAGFMRLLSASFTDKWTGRLLNIHPSLLPAFKGLDAHGQVLQAGVEYSGCTVHFVDATLDGGVIVGQSVCAVLPEDTASSLAERVKRLEHALYPRLLLQLCQQRIQLVDGKLVRS